jgi:hypothetical protein
MDPEIRADHPEQPFEGAEPIQQPAELSQAERVELPEIARADDEEAAVSGELDDSLKSRGLNLRVENRPDGTAEVVGVLRAGDEVAVDPEPLSPGNAVLHEATRVEGKEEEQLSRIHPDEMEADDVLDMLRETGERTRVALVEATQVAEILEQCGVAARRIKREGEHTAYMVSEDGIEQAAMGLRGEGFDVQGTVESGKFSIEKEGWRIDLYLAAA